MFFLWLPMYWAYLNFKCLGDLSICYFFVFPKVVGEFLIYLVVG